MKESILFLCVNYCTYDELINYLQSIDKAFIYINKELRIDVMVADNSISDIQNIDISNYSFTNMEIKPYYRNHGYMGSVMKLIDEKGVDNVKCYDFVIISNVDLVLSESFFVNLLNTQVDPNVGWIAPQIFSKNENRDRNPKIITRPSLKKINILIFMYKYPLLFRFYNGWVYRLRTKRLKSISNYNIYAGHGSIMIFSKSFMRLHANFKFPCFLFGEELFFGELVRLSNLDVIYNPEIIVQDIDHASTGKLQLRSYCKMNYESLTRIKDIFWK